VKTERSRVTSGKGGRFPARAASNKKTTKSISTRTAPTELRREFLVKLGRLRSATKEVGRSYVANIEHDIVELIDGVDGTGDGRAGKRVVKVSTLAQLSAIFEALSLKPEKGRRRDLKKIERAVRAMAQVLLKGKN